MSCHCEDRGIAVSERGSVVTGPLFLKGKLLKINGKWMKHRE